MRLMIEQCVDEAIDEIFVDRLAQLKPFIKNHGRKKILVDRLTEQVKLIDKTHHQKLKIDKPKIKAVVKDFVKMFGKLAQTEADAHNKAYNTNLMSEFAKKFNQKEETGEWNVKVETL